MAEQRKVVTILFAAVVGSTAMAGRSDPEVVRATMARSPRDKATCLTLDKTGRLV
jgi:class 3 adenylate cyclase